MPNPELVFDLRLGPDIKGLREATIAIGGGISAGLHPLPGPLRPMGLLPLPAVFKDITSSMVRMASVASPAAFRAWAVALEDVQGVIGRTFVPVLNLMREGVRLFGDVLAEVLPNQQEVGAALAEFRQAFRDMGREVRAVMATAGPDIRDVLIAGPMQLGH